MRFPRTQAQRAQDDHDADLRMAGLQPEPDFDQELADRESRHFDFIFAPWTGGAMGAGAEEASPSGDVRRPLTFKEAA